MINFKSRSNLNCLFTLLLVLSSLLSEACLSGDNLSNLLVTDDTYEQSVVVETPTVDGLASKSWQILTALTEDFSPRTSATDEEKQASVFLQSEFKHMGLITEVQAFNVELFDPDSAFMYVSIPRSEEIDASPIFMSGTGESSGILVDVGKALESDLIGKDIDGNIALIERGKITFQDKVSNVLEEGAVGAVIYNNVPGGFNARLLNQVSIPVVSISKESGIVIKKSIEVQEIESTISVSASHRESRNIIAEKPGEDREAGVILIGAHYDTVPNTQGANDNGSGISTLFALANFINDKSYPFTIRYVAFGSEEIGLFGSRHYVNSLTDAELDKIIAMINFDVVGSGEFIELIGDDILVNRVLDYGNANNFSIERGVELDWAASDHAPFSEVGVPVLFILADDLSRINQPGDDLQFIDPILMGTAAISGIALIESFNK